MKIDIINKKNYSISQKLESIIEKKIERLSKYFSDDASVKILLKNEGKKDSMEISVEQNGIYLRAEGIGENMYDLVDLVVPKLERQILKHKQRLEKKLRDSAFVDYEQQIEKHDINMSTKVVKEKEFNLVPMSVEDAIYKMDIIGHDFYVFLNTDTNSVEVLYRRNDGDYGLIKPIV